MAIGLFKFTKPQRIYLGLVFVALNVVQIVCGLVITGWSIYLCVNVAPLFYAEKGEMKFVFTVTALYGTHIVLHYLIGLKVCERCYKKAQKKSTNRNLTIWTLMCMNTLLNVFILATLAVETSKHMVRSLKHSIEKGMKNYLRHAEWKYNVDFWQFSMQCCGVESYDDWFEVVWLNKYQIKVDSEEVKQYKLSVENLLLPIIPWSCCKINFPMQCFHDPMQQKQSQHIWAEQPNLIMESINTDGCLSILRRPIENGLIMFIIFSCLLIVNQFFILIVARLFFTACRNAVILGDPETIAPGWIFNRGIGSKKGRTLSEILLDMGMVKEQLPRYREIKTPEISKPRHVVPGANAKVIKADAAADVTADESLSELEQTVIHRGARDEDYEEHMNISPRSDGGPVSEGEEEVLMIK